MAIIADPAGGSVSTGQGSGDRNPYGPSNDTSGPHVTYGTVTNHDGSQDRIRYEDGVPVSRVQIRPPRSTGSSGSSGGGGGGSAPIGYGGITQDPATGLWGQYDDRGRFVAFPGQSGAFSGGGQDDPSVYITKEFRGGQEYNVAYDRVTGQELWAAPTGQSATPSTPSVPSSPTVREVGGVLYQYDPNTGQWAPAPGLPGNLSGAVRPQTFGSASSGSLASSLNAIAKLIGPSTRGGSSGGVDPNIAARQQAELAILNKRFELDKQMALINLAIDLQLIDRQEGERMLDRAVNAAGMAADNRISIADFERQLLNDRADMANLFSQQISDVNPARFNAFLQAGGGNIANALAGGETALDDLAILPSAMTMQALRTPVEAPAPFDPFEFYSQFQNAAGGGGGSGGAGLGIPSLDDLLGQLFGSQGGPSVPAGTSGSPAGGTGAPAQGAPDGVQSQNIDWTAAARAQAAMAGGGGTAGNLGMVGGTTMSDGSVLLPNGTLLSAAEAQALNQELSGFSMEEEKFLQNLTAGMGGTDAFSQQRTLANTQEQLRRMGFDFDLNAAQQLLRQGEDPELIMRAVQQGLDLNSFLASPQLIGATGTGGSTFTVGGQEQTGWAPHPSLTDPTLSQQDAATQFFGSTTPTFTNLSPEEQAILGEAFGITPNIVQPTNVYQPPTTTSSGSNKVVTSVLRKAQGGPVPPGQPFIAGDQANPELIMPRRDGGFEVIPFDQLPADNPFVRHAPRFAEGTVNPYEAYRQERLRKLQSGEIQLAQPTYTPYTPPTYQQPAPQPAPEPTPTPPPTNTTPPPTNTTPPANTTPPPEPPPPVVPPAGSTPTQPPATTPPATPQDDVLTGLAGALAQAGINPDLIPINPQLQPLIDEIRAIREATQVPDIGIRSIFDPRFLSNAVYPTQREAYLQARQTKEGIPAQDLFAEAQRFAIPGLDFAGIRSRV